MPAGLLGIHGEAAQQPQEYSHAYKFRDSPDVGSMQGYGLDLSSYQEVKARASEIYGRLADGGMPCDEPWPPERLGLFKLLIDEGLPP